MPLQLDKYTYAIDISAHNRINWDLLPAWIEIVGIKASEGIGYEDPMFKNHIENALERGKLVNPYHFYRTKVGGAISNPISQAQWFLEVIAPYKSDIRMRSNDVERGPYSESAYGGYYNPPVSTILTDLTNFQKTLSEASWSAYDMIYTGWGTWTYWGLQNPGLLDKLRLWLSKGYADGLWVALYPYDHPKKEADLPYERDPTDFYPYPYPFEEHFMWQVASDFVLPGSLASNGLAKTIDFNIIPYPIDEVMTMLSIEPEEPPEPPIEPGDDEMIVIEGLQEQIDELKATQEQILAGQEEIKALIAALEIPTDGGGDSGGGVVDPTDSWPQFVKDMYGNWDAVKALVPKFVISNRAAVWKVTADKAAVWSEQSRYTQERSESVGGGVATKIIFETHDIPKDYPNGHLFPAYKDMIPNNVDQVPAGGIAADGEAKIELIEYPGYVVRPKHATMVGYFGTNGNYIAV